jgi:predicted MFS family arabinose efflux permease
MLMLVSVTLYGFIIVTFAASHWFWLSMVLMVIVGLCHVHCHALVQTIIQSYSPSEFRGRTMAIFHMSQVVMTAGAMLYCALSSMVGAQWAVAAMGAALIMIGIAWRCRVPGISDSDYTRSESRPQFSVAEPAPSARLSTGNLVEHSVRGVAR